MLRKTTIIAGFAVVLGGAAALGHGDKAPQTVNNARKPDQP